MGGTYSSGNYMFIGYLGALLFALAQLFLATCLLASGIINIFFHKKEGKWIDRFKLINPTSDLHRIIIGGLKIFLSLLLSSPFLFDAHYLYSVFACMVSIGYFLFLTRQSHHNEAKPRKFVHYFLSIIAVVSLSATTFEQRDAIELGYYLAAKVKKYRDMEVAWQNKYDSIVPKAGEIATDFEIASYDQTHSVRLSDFKGKKPVALLFGSYT